MVCKVVQQLSSTIWQKPTDLDIFWASKISMLPKIAASSRFLYAFLHPVVVLAPKNIVVTILDHLCLIHTENCWPRLSLFAICMQLE